MMCELHIHTILAIYRLLKFLFSKTFANATFPEINPLDLLRLPNPPSGIYKGVRTLKPFLSCFHLLKICVNILLEILQVFICADQLLVQTMLIEILADIRFNKDYFFHNSYF